MRRIYWLFLLPLPLLQAQSRVVVLPGSAHPLARPESDLGPASPELELDSIMLGLNRTAIQQAGLDRLLAGLQNPRSPLYHRWLTPEEYAQRFGAGEADIARVTDWLESSGFQVLDVARGRGMIRFSGTAAQVERALHAPIHRYRVGGEEHFAPSTAPSIPAELAHLVSGIRGLDDFRPKAALTARPQLQDNFGDNLLVPDDLATIYDLGPLSQNGMNGAGQSIAVVGGSDLDTTDISNFRQSFNLPPANLTRVLVPHTRNPGMNSAMMEADLDLEWAGALAPQAQIYFVFTSDPMLAAFYAIDQAVAPVLSTSFGFCEWHVIPSDFTFYRSYSQQAAAEGITWVSSTGDSGAAGCEDATNIWTEATTRLSAEMPATLPEVTAVGGTEFNEGAGTYFTARPGPNGGTAMSYIPEMAWNDEPAIQDLLDIAFGLQTTGYGFAAGGGGASLYWSKPQWQTGPGVPNDGARDVPDISMTASPLHDPYYIISSGQATAVGGTSASTPLFAGILALLNQYLVANNIQPKAGLGNINPTLYSLAQNNPAVFHDVTSGGNQVPCVPGSTQDCPQSGVFGYSAGAGYDLATGLGSVDVAQLFAAWAQAAAH